jgi:hypothetical protein
VLGTTAAARDRCVVRFIALFAGSSSSAACTAEASIHFAARLFLGRRSARRSRLEDTQDADLSSAAGDNLTMRRLWILGTAGGKVRVLLGNDAVREKRKLAKEIDETIGRALSGDLSDSEMGKLEHLAALADRLARGGT